RGMVHLDPGSLATQFVLFLAGGTLICFLCESLHRATRRADDTVSELQRAEAGRRASEDRLRSIIASAPGAIIAVDAAGRGRLFSAGAEQTFGWRAEEVIGARLDRFLPERYRADHGRHIRQFGKTGIDVRAMAGDRVLMALRRNGEEFPIEARIS